MGKRKCDLCGQVTGDTYYFVVKKGIQRPFHCAVSLEKPLRYCVNCFESLCIPYSEGGGGIDATKKIDSRYSFCSKHELKYGNFGCPLCKNEKIRGVCLNQKVPEVEIEKKGD